MNKHRGYVVSKRLPFRRRHRLLRAPLPNPRELAQAGNKPIEPYILTVGDGKPDIISLPATFERKYFKKATDGVWYLFTKHGSMGTLYTHAGS